MTMKPIYKPKGAAAEYGDYAVNIYTGCPHRCYYCFAPQVLHREKETFHSCDGEMAHEKEPFAETPASRICTLEAAKLRGIHTWVSFEPVLDPTDVLCCIRNFSGFIDKVKIGKLNYHTSDIDWAWFGQKAEALCQEIGLDYYIKDSLRAEMEKA